MPKKFVMRPEKEKPPKKIVLEETDLLEEEESPSEEELEAEEKLSDFRARFTGKEFKIRIDRFNNEEGEWEWVDRIQWEGFDLFSVKKKYGPGRYRVILFDGDGKYIKGGRTEFRFAAPAKDETPAAPPNPLENPIVALMLQQAEKNTAMMMEVLKTTLPAQAAAKSMDLPQVLDALAKMNSMVPKTDSSKSLLDSLNMIEKVRSLFGAGEEKDSGGLLSEIKEAIALLPAIQTMSRMSPGAVPRPGGPAAPMVPTVVTPGAVIQPPPQERRSMDATTCSILFYVPKFVEAAKAGENVTQWGEYLYTVLETDIVPLLVKKYNGFINDEGVWERLLEAAEKPEEVEKIYTYAPELIPYKKWVSSVIASAYEFAQPHEEPEPSSAVVAPEESA